MDQAFDAVRNLLIEDPDSVAANALMLRVMIHRKDAGAAVNILDRLKLLDPSRRDDYDAHAASIQYQDGEALAATARLEALLKVSPEFDEARRLLVKILDQQGLSHDANQHVRSMMGHTGLSLEELVGLVFPTRSRNGAPDPVTATVDTGTLDPYVIRVASALRINGNPREALACLDASGWLVDHRSLAAVSLYGRTLADAQLFDELEAWAATTPQSCQRYPDYWIACGTLARRQDKEVAIECFIRAIQREPGSIDAFYGIVQSLEEEGKLELAKPFRNRLTELDSIARDVRELRGSASPTPRAFVDIATQLANIGRPLEAVAWQELAISSFSPDSEQLRLIPQYKAQVLSRFPMGYDETEIQCGWVSPIEDVASMWLAEIRSKDPTQLNSKHWTKQSSIPSGLSVTTPNFKNVAEQKRLTFRYLNAAEPVEREFQIFQAFGGGVACLDFDCDGAVDFYFAQAGTTPPDGRSDHPNELFRNLGDEFVGVVSSSYSDDRGYTVGVSAGDWNQDGFADLLIGSVGHNRLLINQGDGTFRTDQNSALRDQVAYTSSLAIADLTGDGLPDIIEINYLDDPAIFEPIRYGADGKPKSLPGPLQFKPAMDRLLVSVGDGSMLASPLGNQTDDAFRPGLALLVTDLDGQPGNEVFVANDLRANQMWFRGKSSDGVSRWDDGAVGLGVAYGAGGKPMACMGVAAADFDQNGRLDLHVSNFEDEWSNQYMQTTSGTFEDCVVSYKLDVVTRKMLGFGTQAIDYDNDTVWDLIVGNGHIEDQTDKGSMFAMPTQVLAGRSDGFLLQQCAGDDDYWNSAHFTRGMAKCDFNRDGLVDVVATDLKKDVVLLQNQTVTDNHWLQLELVGTSSERDAVGARVTIEFKSKALVQAVQTGDGYLSKNESALFVGLGKADSIDQVRVLWPSGIQSVYRDLACDHRWLLVEDQADACLAW
ncbi:FG-GAP-like repeat-containing protein [Rubripirellula reticaptiva]|uniref:ASPIC and UnbV n=1 Tax=Rubripirellula reticaptiva TaxID=2528013 RepID=A0A5C6F3J1_9BACT|nr:FG-GAP-like repeat-containing protein [Rubripirellula reticaptiva]TWU55898.1 ASPIC and UnbV [Rubripirellula reticaptiva]